MASRRLARFAGFLVAILSLIPIHASAASAWSLRDTEKNLDVRIEKNRMLAGKDASSRSQVLVFDAERWILSRSRYYEQEGDIQFEIRQNQIWHHGVAIADCKGDKVQFLVDSDAAFQIEMKRLKTSRPRWRITVKKGEETVVTGTARHLIEGKRAPNKAQMKTDIRNRVRIYLAWRELMAGLNPLEPNMEPYQGEDDKDLRKDHIALAEAARNCYEQALQRNPAFMKGGTLAAEWRANDKGQLEHLALTQNPFSASAEFTRCVLVRARLYKVRWSAAGKPELILAPAR